MNKTIKRYLENTPYTTWVMFIAIGVTHISYSNSTIGYERIVFYISGIIIMFLGILGGIYNEIYGIDLKKRR